MKFFVCSLLLMQLQVSNGAATRGRRRLLRHLQMNEGGMNHGNGGWSNQHDDLVYQPTQSTKGTYVIVHFSNDDVVTNDASASSKTSGATTGQPQGQTSTSGKFTALPSPSLTVKPMPPPVLIAPAQSSPKVAGYLTHAPTLSPVSKAYTRTYAPKKQSASVIAGNPTRAPTQTPVMKTYARTYAPTKVVAGYPIYSPTQQPLVEVVVTNRNKPTMAPQLGDSTGTPTSSTTGNTTTTIVGATTALNTTTTEYASGAISDACTILNSTLSLNFEYDVSVDSENSALIMSKIIHDQVETQMTNLLHNKQTATQKCDYAIQSISVGADAVITGKACSATPAASQGAVNDAVQTTTQGPNTNQTKAAVKQELAAVPCFQLLSTVTIQYTGTDVKKQSAYLDVIKALPLAFKGLSGQATFEKAIVPATTSTGAGVAASQGTASNSANNEAGGGLQPAITAFIVLLAFGVLFAGVVILKRRRKIQSDRRILKEISTLRHTRSLPGTNVDKLQLHESDEDSLFNFQDLEIMDTVEPIVNDESIVVEPAMVETFEVEVNGHMHTGYDFTGSPRTRFAETRDTIHLD
jgi:hypothetical protein